MAEGNQSDPLSSVLVSVSRLLQEDDIQGVVIGGIAASILGRPRYTNDVDIVILDLDDRIQAMVARMKKFDMEPRISDYEKFAAESRMLLMRHVPSGINIDISMGLLPFERDAVSRSRSLLHQGLTIPLPTPEDLIVFKAISPRSVDEEDIKAIVKRHPDLDKDRVLSILREFFEILEKPELLKNIESILSDV